ncbi:MAG: HI0074 family nucleotidyltransferase substrate-binding subunit [Oligoflexales bacterium]|nr:HI0074 family nucleotidyltransferase substrate-binding subunit [Oligoflexales bacterium]
MKEKTKNNLQKAAAKLRKFLEKKNLSELEQAGVIQAFEFTYELLWKALKEKAEEEGLSAPSPRSAFKAAFQLHIVTDEKLFLSMIEDRNLTCHTYNETLAHQIFLRIQDRYVSAIEAVVSSII